MKKIEAVPLAKYRSSLVIEYIENILSKNNVKGRMDFNSYKIDGHSVCTLNIYVPSDNIEKHINLEITSDHCDILYEQLFDDLLKTFLEHETMGVSKYYSVKYGNGQNFSGVNVINSKEGQVRLNFILQGQRFDEIAKSFNGRINAYIEGLQNSEEKHKIGSR